MSGCNIFFDDDRCGKVMQRPVEGTCSICNPQEEVNRAEDACVCPPLGEPRLLTVAAPVVFDECGINLCKVLQSDSLNRFDDVDSVQLRVVDIDFNIQKNNEGSRVEFIEDRPNCVRVYLSNICVKLAVKLLDDDCNIIDEFCIDQLFLPDSSDPEYDEQTNPSFIIVDLYAPYGVSYKDCYGDCEPTINYIGFLESINNAIRQGIGAQALAKVVRFDPRRGLLAVGLTIYLKVIYFIQYRIPHEGLCVPPKCTPISPIAENVCLDFVEGNLLEQSIQPLELCCRPTSFRRSGAVEDPTPAEECADESPAAGGTGCGSRNPFPTRR